MSILARDITTGAFVVSLNPGTGKLIVLRQLSASLTQIPDEVLDETRLLGSSDRNARRILAVVFTSDKQILSNLQHRSPIQLNNRVLARPPLDTSTPDSTHPSGADFEWLPCS
jgi:hypothetical protein